MGRHKKMTAATTPPAIASSHGAGVPTGQNPWDQAQRLGPDLSDVDPQRRHHIESVEPESVSVEEIEQLRPWVVWCVTRVPFTARQTDLKGA